MGHHNQGVLVVCVVWFDVRSTSIVWIEISWFCSWWVHNKIPSITMTESVRIFVFHSLFQIINILGYWFNTDGLTHHFGFNISFVVELNPNIIRSLCKANREYFGEEVILS